MGGNLVRTRTAYPSGMRRLKLLIVLPPAMVYHADITGKVVGVTDADTLTVLEDRTQAKIRLHGIDAPESGRDFGSKAK